MILDRRDFLRTGLAAAATGLLPTAASAQSSFSPRPERWRTFEVTTRIELAEGSTPARAWVPLPGMVEPDWFRLISTHWSGSGAMAVQKDPTYGADILVADFAAGTAPVLETTSRFETRDRATDFSRAQGLPALGSDEVRRYTAPTALIPTDGIVRHTSDAITKGARTDLDKARRIYDWIVDNTFRDPKVRGCGVGDVASMLHVRNLGGKCADLNALYVGLARAAGLPARDVYGIRVAPSRFGYKSLGANSEIVTKAQHCRAEVFLAGWGWVPVDPADVRKVALEEPPGNLSSIDPKVLAARAALFGHWEMNWLPYNTAHDVSLPGSSGPAIGFLMYPQGETTAGRLDCLDPERFKYRITAREITV